MASIWFSIFWYFRLLTVKDRHFVLSKFLSFLERLRKSLAFRLRQEEHQNSRHDRAGAEQNQGQDGHLVFQQQNDGGQNAAHTSGSRADAQTDRPINAKKSIGRDDYLY